MPKAFLLKYKKRCEYFGKRTDDIGSCETSVQAINLKTKSNDFEEDFKEDKGRIFNIYCSIEKSSFYLNLNNTVLYHTK